MNAAGTIYGLNLMHGKKQLIRAAMEGAICNIYSVYEVINQLNSNVKKIKASGGYSNSEVWLQIQADIFNREIELPNVKEATVLGAAYVCMLATGAVKSFEQGLPVMKSSKVIKPIGKKCKNI